MNSQYKTAFICLGLCLGSLHGEEAPPQPAAPAPMQESSPAGLQFTVEPKSRALDYIQAFNYLRQEKTAGKVAFLLKDGSTINNIIDIHLMDQGSLLILRYNSGQGIKFRVLGLEEIQRLEHL